MLRAGFLTHREQRDSRLRSDLAVHRGMRRAVELDRDRGCPGRARGVRTGEDRWMHGPTM